VQGASEATARQVVEHGTCIAPLVLEVADAVDAVDVVDVAGRYREGSKQVGHVSSVRGRNQALRTCRNEARHGEWQRRPKGERLFRMRHALTNVRRGRSGLGTGYRCDLAQVGVPSANTAAHRSAIVTSIARALRQQTACAPSWEALSTDGF